MAQLDSRLTRDDLDVLIEAMGDWETVGNHEFHVLEMVKNVPLPPEDNQAFEFIKNLKDHFQTREREIIIARGIRQEKAIFLKAKLALNKSDMAVDQLFSDARTTPVTVDTKESPVPQSTLADKKLALAEQFIEECAITKHYQSFLQDHAEELK